MDKKAGASRLFLFHLEWKRGDLGLQYAEACEQNIYQGRNGQLEQARGMIEQLLFQRDVVIGALKKLEIEVAQSV